MARDWASELGYSELEEANGLPPGLLAALQHVESGGDPEAVSPKGAKGLFQFMPETAAEYKINPLIPEESAPAAAKMLGTLNRKYNGDLSKALAGYNWGQGNVDRQGLENAPAETRSYIDKIQNMIQGGGGQDTLAGGEDLDALFNALPDEPTAQAAPPEDLDALFSALPDAKAVAKPRINPASIDPRTGEVIPGPAPDPGAGARGFKDLLQGALAGTARLPIGAEQLAGEIMQSTGIAPKIGGKLRDDAAVNKKLLDNFTPNSTSADVGASITQAIGAGGASSAPTAIGRIMAALGSGTVMGATNPTNDAAADSDQALLERAKEGLKSGAISGALGAVGEGVMAGGKALGRKVFGVGGELTPEQIATKELAAKHNVPLTAGDISQNPAQQAMEDTALKGGKGAAAQDIAQATNVQKKVDFANAVDNVRSEIGGRREFQHTGQAAERVGKSIVDQANAEREIYRNAYNQVTDGLTFDREAWKAFADNARSDMAAVHFLTPDTAGKAYGQLSALDNGLERMIDPNTGQIDLKSIDAWRGGVNRSLREVERGSQEEFALNLLKKKADGFLEGLIDSKLASGDPAIFDQLKQARGLRAAYAEKYKPSASGDYGRKALDDLITQSRYGSEPYTGEQIVNKMLGQSKLGFGQQAVGSARQIKKIFGENSPEFHDMKLEAANRVLSPIMDKLKSGDPFLRGDPAVVNYRKNLASFLRDNKTLADEMFSPADQKMLQEIGELGSAAFTRTKGILQSGKQDILNNYLKTASKAALTAKLGKFGAIPAALGGDAMNAAAMRQSVDPVAQDIILKKLNGAPSTAISDGIRRMVTIGAIGATGKSAHENDDYRHIRDNFPDTPEANEKLRPFLAPE